MAKKTTTLKALSAALLFTAVLTSCTSQANRASENVSTAADNFEINRRVTFINGITNDTTFVVEGFCSINKDDKNQLQVTCKDTDGGITKDYFGLSDNSYYLVEQLDSKNVSVYHRKVIMNPKSVIPDIDIQTNGK